MHYEGWGFWGMHFFWWLFWIAGIVALFSLFVPVPRSQRHQTTPLEILQRRYAAGDITSEEYEERKAKLEQDTNQGTSD